MKTILFFGDSNTWGYHPVTGRRYSTDERFTGRLSNMLSECRIIEEGLKGRTTATDDEMGPLRNGRKALPMVLCTHDPIDYLVIMLGTNDVKRRFQLSPGEIAEGLERLIQIVKTPHLWDGTAVPEILIVCPANVSVDYVGSAMNKSFDHTSVEKAKALHGVYEELAKQYGCAYLNAMEYAQTGVTDGVHLEADGHQKLADALYQELKRNMM